jgi:methylmalonyl-CoA/ethylmalonyl-CoA epimerase
MITGADFDHVAVAGESRAVLESRYAGELGGMPLAGGRSPGFRWAQLEYANGMVVEMLEPDRIERNDFLRRFLDRNGPGPHHLTFTVPDFRQALESAEAAGYSPVGVEASDRNWKEAFLHPKQAPGIVIQLAESHEHHRHPVRSPSAPSVELVHVAHAVQSLEEGLRLFERLLAGEVVAEGTVPSFRWVELGWTGPGRLRLLEPRAGGPIDQWLGGRTGRLHHLAFVVPEPSTGAGAIDRGDHWEVDPQANQGTRLLLAANAALFSASVAP